MQPSVLKTRRYINRPILAHANNAQVRQNTGHGSRCSEAHRSQPQPPGQDGLVNAPGQSSPGQAVLITEVVWAATPGDVAG